MIFIFAVTDAHRTLARAFAERAAASDRAGRFDHETIAALHEAGWLAISLPQRLGGTGDTVRAALGL